MGIRLIFLVEHGKDIACLEDVKNWINPRIKYSPKATKGETLYKVLSTIKTKYNCDFIFCEKSQTGQKIIDILTV